MPHGSREKLCALIDVETPRKHIPNTSEGKCKQTKIREVNNEIPENIEQSVSLFVRPTDINSLYSKLEVKDRPTMICDCGVPTSIEEHCQARNYFAYYNFDAKKPKIRTFVHRHRCIQNLTTETK